jgi:hypothetical protein
MINVIAVKDCWAGDSGFAGGHLHAYIGALRERGKPEPLFRLLG